jgi:hypothetical protein
MLYKWFWLRNTHNHPKLYIHFMLETNKSFKSRPRITRLWLRWSFCLSLCFFVKYVTGRLWWKDDSGWHNPEQPVAGSKRTQPFNSTHTACCHCAWSSASAVNLTMQHYSHVAIFVKNTSAVKEVPLTKLFMHCPFIYRPCKLIFARKFSLLTFAFFPSNVFTKLRNNRTIGKGM